MKSRDIIQAVAKKHNLQPMDILGRDRFGHFIAARREAMTQLSEAGFSSYQIAAFFGRDHSTVLFHVSASYRERRLAAMRKFSPRAVVTA